MKPCTKSPKKLLLLLLATFALAAAVSKCNNTQGNQHSGPPLSLGELKAGLAGDPTKPCQAGWYWPFYFCSWHHADISEISELDQYGYSVAIDGDYAVVGAPHFSTEAILAQDGGNGAAYVFVRNGYNWKFLQKLKPNPAAIKQKDGSFEEQTYAAFGESVAMANGRIFIGAHMEDNGSVDVGPAQIGNSAGAVYIFELAGEEWVMTGKLFEGNMHGANYGTVISANEDTFAVTKSSETTTQPDTVYVYRFANGLVKKEATLVRPGLNEGPESFGDSLSLYANRLAIGNPSYGALKDGKFIYDVGEVRLYRREKDGIWKQEFYRHGGFDSLDLSGEKNTGSRFSRSVSLFGSTLLVGAPLRDYHNGNSWQEGVGEVHVYKHKIIDDVPEWVEETVLTPVGQISQIFKGSGFGWHTALNNDVALISFHYDYGVIFKYGYKEASGWSSPVIWDLLLEPEKFFDAFQFWTGAMAVDSTHAIVGTRSGTIRGQAAIIDIPKLWPN